MTTSVYGLVFVAKQLEQQIEATLRLWFPAYLAAIAEQLDEEVLPVPRSYNRRPVSDRWPEDQLPSVVIVGAGTDGEPYPAGDGYISAPYRYGIVVFASGQSVDGARNNAQTYAAAVRLIMLHKRGFGGLCQGIEFASETFDEIPLDGARSLGAATSEFIIDVPAIARKDGGPATPDVPPDAVLSTVETVELAVENPIP